MPRITRKQQKIFASAASNNGVFGSLQGADPTLSSDPDAIQGRTAYANGWNDATFSSELLPPLEEFQALQYLFSRQIAYIMQEGIPEWDASTTYYKGNMVKVVSGDDYTLFESIADNNTGNLTSDTTRWKVCGVSQDFNTGIHFWRADVTYGLGDWVRGVDANGSPDIFQSLQASNKGNAVTNAQYWNPMGVGKNGLPLLTPLFYDRELNDTSWLRADTWSWQDGSIYVSAYDLIEDQYTNGTQGSETVGSYTIQFKTGPNGMKIVSAANAGTVEDIYEESGVAWYYIIDTTNTRFKLPRTKYGFVGLRDTVGKYVPESLPNIRGNLNIRNSTQDTGLGTQASASGAFKLNQTGTSKYTFSDSQSLYNVYQPEFDASLSSSSYKDSASVQQRSTQMYLYFYVGNTVRNQTEVDVGEITEALNKKWDSSNMQVVNALPVNPQTGVFYFVK